MRHLKKYGTAGQHLNILQNGAKLLMIGILQKPRMTFVLAENFLPEWRPGMAVLALILKALIQQWIFINELSTIWLMAELQKCLIREDRMALAQRCFDFLPTRAELDLLGWDEPNDIFHH